MRAVSLSVWVEICSGVHGKTYAFLVAPGSSRSTGLGGLALGDFVIGHVDVGWMPVDLVGD